MLRKIEAQAKKMVFLLKKNSVLLKNELIKIFCTFRIFEYAL